jgi:hypothetical protein
MGSDLINNEDPNRHELPHVVGELVSCCGLARHRIRLHAEGEVHQYRLLLVESWLALGCLEIRTKSCAAPLIDAPVRKLRS